MLSNMKTLLGLLIVFGGIAFWLSSKQNITETNLQPLIPAWQDDQAQINAIDQVILSKDEEQLMLTKTANVWQLNGGFYASIDPLFDLMQSLRTALIIEEKTANPDKHALLELSDQDMVVKLLKDDVVQHAFHLGKQSTNGLTFVRRVGENQTYAVKGLKPLSVVNENWMLKTVLDVASKDVQAVTFSLGSDEEEFTVNRDPVNGDLHITEIPTDYQSQANVDLEQVLGGLSRLMIDQALTVDEWNTQLSELEAEPKQISVNFTLNTGIEIKINLTQQEQDYYIGIESSEYPHYAGWVMKIAGYKFNALNRQLSELIEPIAVEEQPQNEEEGSSVE